MGPAERRQRIIEILRRLRKYVSSRYLARELRVEAPVVLKDLRAIGEIVELRKMVDIGATGHGGIVRSRKVEVVIARIRRAGK